MKIQLTIDLGLSPQTKRWTLRLGIPVLVLCAGAVAYAFTSPATWNTGDTLQAVDLNSAFANLQSQVTALQDAGAACQADVAALQDAGSTVAVSYYQNAATNVTNSALTQLTGLGARLVDTTSAAFNGSVFTVPVSGTYEECWNITFNAVFQQPNVVVWSYARKNASPFVQKMSTSGLGGAADRFSVGACTIVAAVVGDTLDVAVDQNDSASRSTSSDQGTFVSFHRVGN